MPLAQIQNMRCALTGILYIARVRYLSQMSRYLSSTLKDKPLISAIVPSTILRSSRVSGGLLRLCDNLCKKQKQFPGATLTEHLVRITMMTQTQNTNKYHADTFSVY